MEKLAFNFDPENAPYYCALCLYFVRTISPCLDCFHAFQVFFKSFNEEPFQVREKMRAAR